MGLYLERQRTDREFTLQHAYYLASDLIPNRRTSVFIAAVAEQTDLKTHFYYMPYETFNECCWISVIYIAYWHFIECIGLLVCHCHFIQPQGCKINKIWLIERKQFFATVFDRTFSQQYLSVLWSTGCAEERTGGNRYKPVGNWCESRTAYKRSPCPSIWLCSDPCERSSDADVWRL